ncbi:MULTISPECIES: CPBP family intramembrane glutamic endopeptidase [Aequorivita]|uniref:CPBP family intramembrane metalloprotease n=1 Tax=Aequorivita iocasae TaxID=2803865 RepID=A0ABX7DXB1_9FLAO|nr:MULTISPECIES: type II CAAX endopeptidase family protein [Aequorivita]QQX77799.1 CPBP family intramembrane metalloprotease [Aequorivita iocasae]UCA57299.1 CPBP family intramembrane metalloprotease [Aequorivita sp. F7]
MSCKYCSAPVKQHAKYCGGCGKAIQQSKHGIESKSVQLVIAFYLTFLLYSIIAFFIYKEDEITLQTEIIIESIFIVLTLFFSFFDFKKILALYNVKYISWQSMIFGIVFPIFTAIVVYIFVEEINSLLFDESDNIFYEYAAYNYPLFWALLFTVIFPPIFEELAFRGFLFNQLRNFANPWVTIIATAFIFALVHFSFLSILWIFPFGMVLGYLRYRYKTLWLGMLVHFIQNLLVLMIDYYYFQNDPFKDLFL